VTRVCFFGAYDPDYPRNRILRTGLERAGLEVVEARVEEHRAFRRYPSLMHAFGRIKDRADVLLVPEFRHKDVPLAHRLKGRRPLVFDPLISRHDTLVRDWGLHREGSAQARWNRRIDRWALGLADRVLCDTWAQGALYVGLGTPRARLSRVLVGAEDAFFAIGPPPSPGPVRIVYVGGFLPLHGVLTVIEAAARLERDHARLPDYRIDLVGSGIQYRDACSLAARLGLQRLELAGPIPYAEAPRALSRAHIVLGAFGVTEKAGRVVPHKVYQGLAAGRAVVTGLGPGLCEVFAPGTHLAAVPRGDAEALASTLAELIARPERRGELAARGRERAREIGTPERVGESLRAAIEGRGEPMR